MLASCYIGNGFMLFQFQELTFVLPQLSAKMHIENHQIIIAKLLNSPSGPIFLGFVLGFFSYKRPYLMFSEVPD